MPTPCYITTGTLNSLGVPIASYGQGIPVSTAWQSANNAELIPFTVVGPRTCVAVGWFAGAATATYFDLGIYDRNGTRLASLGATYQSSTQQWSRHLLPTPITLATGCYFMALAIPNTGPQVWAYQLTQGPLMKSLGKWSSPSSYPLPAQATLGLPPQDYIPIIGCELL